MAHLMAPLPATTQHTTVAPKVAPKSPALKNSGILHLGAKCDTRRALLHGLMIAAGGAGSLMGADIASAASKRGAPPAAQTEERKDPNVSGLQAKILASKRRKEAMKESVAKMREKGKPVGN